MSSPSKPFNICDTLRKRLQEINDKKEATQKEIATASDKLLYLFSKGIKTSRETPEQLDKKIDDLETSRTSVSLPLAQEKEILRQIKQIQKAKVVYEENSVHENLIQEKKADINKLRTELSNFKAQIAELEAALSKVELADRLGCSANDLTFHKMDCPKDKLGQVIGKGGSNIKKLETKTGCLIDLDKVKSQIHLQGNAASIKEAISEIENITLAIEIEMTLGKAVFSFLFSKQLAEFNILQENHPNVIFDLSKENSMLKLRGREEFVIPVKEEVMKIDVKMQTLEIPSREAAVIVGKAGKTINQLVADHDVSIQVENKNNSRSSTSDDTSTIIVSGEGNKVEKAMNAIKNLLFKSEDIETSVLVTPMTRNKLLSDSGALIKQLQKDVNEACKPGNSFVRFEELSREERESSSILVVKSARMHIEKAEQIVKERLELYDSGLVTVQIDVDLIPVLIGSKGATIKSIRTAGGAGADIEVDKFTGEVKLMADTETGRNKMKDAINKIIDENQILTLPMEQSMFPVLFGQAGKQIKSKVKDSGVFLRIDDSDTSIILRGSIEKITEAAEDIRQFIASNQSIEFHCDTEDESFLMHRGNLLKTIEKDCNINLSMSKSRRSVVLRGKIEDIQIAEQKLKTLLYGGEGLSVEKLFVPAPIMGIIIGKGGKNIIKYESDHKSLMVNIHSMTRCLSIRGDFDQVELCKRIIMKDMMECNVSESIQINVEGFEKLSKPGAISKIIDGLPVSSSLAKTALRLKGAYTDVQEVMMHVQDFLSGVYTASISLIPENLKKVSSAKEISEEFEKIREATSTSVTLDNELGAITIEGKRTHVKRAKSLLIVLLESVVPSHFVKVKFLKPLLKSMGSCKDAADLTMQTGCDLSLERDICTFIVQSTSSETLLDGVKAIEEKIEAFMKLTYVVQVDSWLIQYMLSKNTNEIEEIKTNSDCDIVLSKNDLIISIIGKEEEHVSSAKSLINNVMNQAKKENVFVDLPESSIDQFVGTSGRQMRSMASSYGVSMERVKKTRSRIRIQGGEVPVTRASKAIDEWVSNWEKKNSGVTMTIEDTVITHLENESSILDDIQRNFGVKIDLNRDKCTATIRGGKSTSQEKASTKLESVLNEVLEKNANKARNKENEVRVISSNVRTSYPEDPIVHSPVTENANNAVGKLYNLLVSDDAAAAAVAVASDAQEWDSSTVSSVLESESPETGVSYFRSASGFHIRL